MEEQWWEQRLDAQIQEEDAADARFEEKRIGIRRTLDEVVRRIRALTEMDDTTREIVEGLNNVVGQHEALAMDYINEITRMRRVNARQDWDHALEMSDRDEATEELEASRGELKDKLQKALAKMASYRNEARDAKRKVVEACKAAHDFRVENKRLRAEVAQLAEQVTGGSLPSSG
jgi:phage/plasmid-associated DNA primase